MATRRTTMQTMVPAAFLLALAACAAPEAAHLWNPKTDHIVKCEPAPDHAQHPEESAAKQAACIDHYRRLGFIEISPPQP